MTEPDDLAEVDAILERCGRSPESTLPILQAIQEHYAYLPETALRRVAETTEIPLATLVGVATFYGQFRLRPAGRHRIKVCVGTACHVKGADALTLAFRHHLSIAEGEDTDPQRLFTVETVACLGCCMLAPVVQIDDVIYGNMRPEIVPSVLRDFLQAQRAAAAAAPMRAGPAAVVGEARLCLCSSCLAGGAAGVYQELERAVRRFELAVKLKNVACTGLSFRAPLLELALAEGSVFRYGKVRREDVCAILLRHFRPVSRARRLSAAVNQLAERLVTDEAWQPVTRYSVDLRDGPESLYSRHQVRVATEHAGVLNPLDFDDYARAGGFEVLRRALTEMTPEAVIAEVAASGLRGRGGAGFPTGRKWEAVRRAAGTEKYIICNGDEGDPGAFMDRMILESFPFRVIEGMALAAFAVGAREGVFYIRAEYPLAVRRVQEALEIGYRRGVLGAGVFGTAWGLDLRVVSGAGAFVCGEETALIAAVEGRRGTPAYRPPYPAQRGFRQQPTLVNNVETLATVPWILRHGAAAFAAIGTPQSRGTKTFALAGRVERGGLIEVPMGMTLRQIVEEIGGGVGPERRLKGIQVGGPSGGCIPAALADTPVDYEALTAAGAMMGSGGMVVLDDTDCMADVARYFLAFTQKESCGRCTFCRVGTRRMWELLERLCAGRAQPEDLGKLAHLAEVVKAGSLCGLGRTAPNVVQTTLKYFRDEYEAHLERRCPAKRCKALIRYVITDDCIGCTRCAQRCPVDAIPMTPYRKHEIDAQKCTRCDTCRQVCPVEAVKVE